MTHTINASYEEDVAPLQWSHATLHIAKKRRLYRQKEQSRHGTPQHLRQPHVLSRSTKTRAGSNHGEPTPHILASRCGSVDPLLRPGECTTKPVLLGSTSKRGGANPTKARALHRDLLQRSTTSRGTRTSTTTMTPAVATSPSTTTSPRTQLSRNHHCPRRRAAQSGLKTTLMRRGLQHGEREGGNGLTPSQAGSTEKGRGAMV